MNCVENSGFENVNAPGCSCRTAPGRTAVRSSIWTMRRRKKYSVRRKFWSPAGYHAAGWCRSRSSRPSASTSATTSWNRRNRPSAAAVSLLRRGGFSCGTRRGPWMRGRRCPGGTMLAAHRSWPGCRAARATRGRSALVTVSPLFVIVATALASSFGTSTCRRFSTPSAAVEQLRAVGLGNRLPRLLRDHARADDRREAELEHVRRLPAPLEQRSRRAASSAARRSSRWSAWSVMSVVAIARGSKPLALNHCTMRSLPADVQSLTCFMSATGRAPASS